METVTVARVIVDQLVALGADTAFGVPGESYLAVLDALYERPELRFVTCRHESGATFAADAHARLTGRPGIAMVTRGPGLTNGSIGIHTAQHDEIPMIVLVGLLPRDLQGRGAFQEIHLEALMGTLAKHVVVLDDPDAAAWVVADAWATALDGRPGPVVIGLPEDLLDQPVPLDVVGALPVPEPVPDHGALAAVGQLLATAERPLAILGGSTWSEAAVSLAPSALPDVPLIAAFRHQDLVDHRAAWGAGALGLAPDPTLVQRVHDADLILAIGTRLDDPTTAGFTLPPNGVPLVHVHPSPAELGRNHRPVMSIAATPHTFLGGLDPLLPLVARHEWVKACRVGYEAWAAGGGPLEALARHLGASLPLETITTNGAGNFTRPFHRAFPYGRPGRQLAPANGSMGYGLPAAVAAALVRPAAPVVCLAGDGDLLMTGQEMATARQHGAALTVLVLDNGSYGTIRSHQERRYPGRRSATDLVNPDFAAWARSFGAEAWSTDDPGEAADLVVAASARRTLSLVHLRTDLI